MIAGLPGTGIGGIFYLFIALWMPVNEVINNLRGHINPERKNLVKKHLFLTLCVILAVIATGWLAGWLALIILFGVHGNGNGDTQVENFLQIAPIILTSLTLLAVILAMHGLRLVMSVHRSLRHEIRWIIKPIIELEGKTRPIITIVAFLGVCALFYLLLQAFPSPPHLSGADPPLIKEW